MLIHCHKPMPACTSKHTTLKLFTTSFWEEKANPRCALKRLLCKMSLYSQGKVRVGTTQYYMHNTTAIVAVNANYLY